MSEKTINARKTMACNLCGQLIQKGEKCRMVRDDFMQLIVHFEHIRCPGACATVSAKKPIQPRLTGTMAMA